MICWDKAPRLPAGRSTSFRHVVGREDRQVPRTGSWRHNPSTVRYSDALCEDLRIPALRFVGTTCVANGTAGHNMAKGNRHESHTESLHLPTLHHSEGQAHLP